MESKACPRKIVVRNARQHNLKGIDVDLPHRALVVVTGPSGSGKSSLAFDTLYAEGQRRYVESLSTYAKQFLERMEKPLVDLVDGISPAVAIEQKNPTKTSRSTVGTATETYDYLRLLWARAGRTYCPACNREVRPDTVQTVTDAVLQLPADTRIMIAFPLPRSARISHERVVENLRALGFLRVMAGGELLDLEDTGKHDLAGTEELLVIVDRIVTGKEARERIADSVNTSFAEGDGEVHIIVAGGRTYKFNDTAKCPDHPHIKFLDPTPRLFSFNNPYGSCHKCTGFGATLEYDVSCIVPNPERSLREGAVDPWEMPRYKAKRSKLLTHAKKKGIDVDAPWHELPKAFRDEIVQGVRGFEGVIPFLESKEEKRYKQYIRVFLRRYQAARTCPECGGTKLRPEALYVRVGNRTIAEMSLAPIDELHAWLMALPEQLGEMQRGIAEPILRELDARLSFLSDVGLAYLTLHRQTRTLSGGEAQRIALANSLGSKLVDTLYVLDEPTVGLHPRDTDRLLSILKRLRDAGNSVIVVEHDPAAMEQSDHLLELGPGSGEKGGHIVFQGTYQEMLSADTATARSLLPGPGRGPGTGPGSGPGPGRGGAFKQKLRLYGAQLHNLKGVDIELPLGALTVVTGVSGSGKSTLVHDVLFRALERELEGGETTAKTHLGDLIGDYKRIDGLSHIDAVVLIDQEPIGKTPRSNPVTYIKAFDQIRNVFAQQPLARQRKYGPGHFSFNVKGGRCEACQGDGVVEIEMVFLADVFIACEICGGARYKPETLEVTFKGLNIRQVLDLTIDEAIRFFIKQDKLGQMLWQLQQVGLGYLRLGQPAPTLSGGEAQRLKIARELIYATRKRGHRIYILDEPTTGLSTAEVRKLLEVIRKLTIAGHSAIVIEHNLEVMQAADWIIDMGPEAGDAGGRVVAVGTPADIARVAESHTGRYLRAARAMGATAR